MNKKERWLILVILGTVLILLAVGGYWFFIHRLMSPVVDDFESCVAAGYPLLEGQPPVCKAGQELYPGPEKLEVVEDEACVMTNCHGLEIECGKGSLPDCTYEYAFGDGCRKLAGCGVVNGRCQPVLSEAFLACRDCVLACKKKHPTATDAADLTGKWECERKCVANVSS